VNEALGFFWNKKSLRGKVAKHLPEMNRFLLIFLCVMINIEIVIMH
jgi:hypothetical protein